MGETLQVEVSFENDSSKLRGYELSLSGDALGFTGFDPDTVHVAPYETGTVRFQISPTGETVPGDYSLVIQILEGGDPIDPPGTLTLNVEVVWAGVVDTAAIERERLEAEEREQARLQEELRLKGEQEAEAARLAAEAQARKAEEERIRAEQEAEAARLAKEEADRIEKARVEEEERLAAQEAEAARLAQEEADRAAAEQARAEEEARLREAQEAEAARLAQEESDRLTAEHARAEEEARQQAEREAALAIQAQQEAEQAARAEEEAKQKAQQEAEAAQRAQEEADRIASEQARLEQEAKLKAEQEARQADEQQSQEAARIAEEQAKEAAAQAALVAQQAAELEAKQQAEQLAKAAEEQAKIQAEEERKQKMIAEAEAEAARIQAEEDQRKAEEAAEVERRRVAEEQKREAEEERKRQMIARAEEEAARIQAEADRKKAEEKAELERRRQIENQKREAEEERKRQMIARAEEERLKLEAEAQAREAEEKAEAARRAQAAAERQAQEEKMRQEAEATRKKEEQEAAALAAEEAAKPKIGVVDGSQLGKPRANQSEEKSNLIGGFRADRVMTDAKTGTQILVKPGESVLVKFTVRHDVQKGQRPTSRSFRLQHNRALPESWLEVVVPTVNVKPNGTGELAILVKPPLDAEPANYPFAVEVGVDGQVFVPSQYVLTVQPVPVVELTTPNKVVTAGLFSKKVPFNLRLQSAGNSETAYRLAVKDPFAADRDDILQHDDLYESGPWQYLFDRELGDLISQAADGKPTPQTHQLNVNRRGIWWFGFVEKHNLKVTAVPVTDTTNALKPLNEIDLVAKRWRLIPLPAFIFWPMTAAVLIFLTSQGVEVRITNSAGMVGDREVVLGTEAVKKEVETTVPLKLALDSAGFLPKTLQFIKEGAADRKPDDVTSLKTEKSQTVKLGVNNYTQDFRVSYKPIFGMNRSEVKGILVGQRTTDMLRPVFKESGSDQEIATETREVNGKNQFVFAPWAISTPADDIFKMADGKSYRLTIHITLTPGVRRRVTFENMSTDYQIHAGESRRPDSNYFGASEFGQDFPKFDPIEKGYEKSVVFSLKEGVSVEEANSQSEESRTWEIITSDGPKRVYRFILKAATEVPN